MPDARDRRAAERFPLMLVAEIVPASGGAQLHARTSDVSRTGCYVDTLNPMPMGTQVRIRLTGAREVFETTAKVVYVSPGLGMGIQFEEIAPLPLDTLDRWLSDVAVRK
jgi:hypothetical protein